MRSTRAASLPPPLSLTLKTARSALCARCSGVIVALFLLPAAAAAVAVAAGAAAAGGTEGSALTLVGGVGGTAAEGLSTSMGAGLVPTGFLPLPLLATFFSGTRGGGGDDFACELFWCCG